MAKVSKSSSIHKKRIHNDYVDRNTRVTNASKVDKVTPVNSTENSTSYNSSNYLIASDMFYDKLEELRQEYKNFYHDELELEKAIKNVKSDKNDNNKLVEHMNELINKYNIAVNSLSHFDRHFNTDYISDIKDIINDFEKELNKVGIKILKEKRLSMDESIFRKKVLSSADAMYNLFRPIRLMIIRLYKVFKNIKVPKDEGYDKKYRDYNELSSDDYSGLMLDEKS